MIPKKRKLPLQYFVGQKGKIVRTPLFTVKIFLPEMAYSRFGVVISAKVSNKAVVRNRIKRVIFNTIRVMIEQIRTADYVIIVSPAAASVDSDQLASVVTKTLLL